MLIPHTKGGEGLTCRSWEIVIYLSTTLQMEMLNEVNLKETDPALWLISQKVTRKRYENRHKSTKKCIWKFMYNINEYVFRLFLLINFIFNKILPCLLCNHKMS